MLTSSVYLKKGKKGVTPEPPPEDTDDVMAQIQKMKALAAAQAAGPGIDTILTVPHLKT